MGIVVPVVVISISAIVVMTILVPSIIMSVFRNRVT
jgi:hypothetical protein